MLIKQNFKKSSNSSGITHGEELLQQLSNDTIGKLRDYISKDIILYKKGMEMMKSYHKTNIYPFKYLHPWDGINPTNNQNGLFFTERANFRFYWFV